MRPSKIVPKTAFTGKNDPVAQHLSNRQLKKKIKNILLGDDFMKHTRRVIEFGERRVVNPLFSFFYDENDLLKWRSVTVMGMVIDHLAHRDMESARVVMRRFLWNLNDESGGIGWGSAEALGETMARNEALAKEYYRMLISYINEAGNFLEHEMLQRGALWGFGRLSHARPHLLKGSAGFLNPFMKSADAFKRGLAAWGAGPLQAEINRPFLQRLLKDENMIEIFIAEKMKKIIIGELAKESLGMSSFSKPA